MLASKNGSAISPGRDFAFKPAGDIADDVRRRAMSPVEIVEAALAAMAVTEPELHAFATPAPEQARADALALEAALGRGEPAGPLAGCRSPSRTWY